MAGRFTFVVILNVILNGLNLAAAQHDHDHSHSGHGGGMDDFARHDPMVQFRQPISRLDGRRRGGSSLGLDSMSRLDGRRLGSSRGLDDMPRLDGRRRVSSLGLGSMSGLNGGRLGSSLGLDAMPRLEGRRRMSSLGLDPMLPGQGYGGRSSLGGMDMLPSSRQLRLPVDHSMDRGSLSLSRLGLGDLPMSRRGTRLRTAHLDLHTDTHGLGRRMNNANLALPRLGGSGLSISSSLGGGHLHGDTHLEHGMNRVGRLSPISRGPILRDAHHLDHGMNRAGALHGAIIAEEQMKMDRNVNKKLKKSMKKQAKKDKKRAKKHGKRLRKVAKLQRKHAVTGKDKFRRKIEKVVRKMKG